MRLSPTSPAFASFERYLTSVRCAVVTLSETESRYSWELSPTPPSGEVPTMFSPWCQPRIICSLMLPNSHVSATWWRAVINSSTDSLFPLSELGSRVNQVFPDGEMIIKLRFFICPYRFSCLHHLSQDSSPTQYNRVLTWHSSASSPDAKRNHDFHLPHSSDLVKGNWESLAKE